MMGSGTTLIEALRYSRASIGIDINPLFRTIVKAKTTYIEKNSVLKVLNRLRNFKSAEKHLWEKYIPSDRNINHWFFPETQKQLATVRYYIETMAAETIDDDIINFLKSGFVSIIRSVSRASRNIGRMFFDPDLIQVDVFAAFEKKVLAMADRVACLKDMSPKPMILDGVSAENTGLGSNSIGLVICHPPYFNLYRYSSIYRYELLWTGINPKEFNAREIHEGFKLGKTEKVGLYVEDMKQVLSEMHRVLSPGCSCVLMIGDAIIKDKRVPTTSLVLDSLERDTSTLAC
jgi:hypothetical protein